MKQTQIQGISYQQLADTFGTPLYIYNSDKIKSQLNEFKKAFSGVNLNIKYAMKSLSNLNIVNYMRTLGTGVDTVTIQEIHMALKVGFSPDDIVFTPNVVDFKYIKEAVALGVAINIENISNLRRFGETYGNTYPVCIRLNPNIIFDLDKAEDDTLNRSTINKEHYAKIDEDRMALWYKQSKFGISLSQYQELKELVKTHNIRVNGLHIHASHVIMDAKTFMKNAQILFELSEAFEHIEYFDFGGGIMVPHKEDDVIANLNEIGEYFVPIYQEFCKKKGKKYQIWFEPGRYLVSEAGQLLTRVDILKSNGVYDFAGVDTGFHHLIRPMMYDAYHAIRNVSNPDGELKKYTIVGNLCEIDNLATDRLLPEIREKDLLVIENAGAYGFSMASNYNSNFRPAEILIYNGQAHVIRRRETLDDLLTTQYIIEL